MRTRLARTPVVLAALVLAATGLSACGSSTKEYCSTLKVDKKYFNSLNSGDAGNFDAAFDKFHELAKKAPSEVADDWKVIDTAITTVQKDLKAANVTFKQLAEAQTTGKLPAGVSQAKLQKVVADFQKLDNAKFRKAGDAIEKHAKKECNIDMSS